jgi:hypothetical protein
MTQDEVRALLRRPTCSVIEAGQALGISRGASYGAAKAGELPVIRIGKRMVVPTAWLASKLGLACNAATNGSSGLRA